MNQSKTVEMEGIGTVLFEPSRRAKRLNVSLRPLRGVRVAVPQRISFKRAKAFVSSKTLWIQKHLDKMKELEDVHQTISRQAAEIVPSEAKKKIAVRLNELAKRHGFTYNKISVRSLKSRWGSCSYKNNISLNIKLIVLPEEILDYVILHELVHTHIRNHSKDFWKALDRLVGNARALDLKLKQYNIMLV
jgi:hypothetical protein